MTYDVFLCHNSKDKPAVRAINEVLRQEFGLQTFLDESTIVGGEEWAAVIDAALAGSAACIVLLGENGWGPYQRDYEARPAIARRHSEPEFRVIPALLPGAAEAAKSELPELFRATHLVDFSGGVLDRLALRALASAARGQQPFPEGRPELTPARLRFDAIRWDTNPRRDESILYTGAELREAEMLAAARQTEMTDLVSVFLEQSRRRELDRRGELLAAHAGALAQDRLPLAARLAALALEHRDNADAHAVLRKAAATLPHPIGRLQHADRVTAIVASGDGSRLLTAAADGGVFRWDTDALMKPTTAVEHGAAVTAVGLAPDGSWFVSGGEDGTINVWDAESGTRLQTLSLGAPVVRIDIAATAGLCSLAAVGGHALPGSPGVAAVWDCSDWGPRWRKADVRDAALLAGGAITVVAIGKSFVLVNTQAGTVAGHGELDEQVTALAAHPTRRGFLATTLSGRIWQLVIEGDQFQGGPIKEAALAIERATFSPDGTRIAIFGADLTLSVLGPGGLELSVPYEGLLGLRASFDDTGSLVAIHSAEARTTTLWHGPSRTRLGVLASDTAAGAMFGLPVRLAIAAAGNVTEVVEVPSGEEARWAIGSFLVTSLMFSPDGRFLARDGSMVAADGRVETRRTAIDVIDASSGAVIAHLDELAEMRVRSFEGAGPSIIIEKDGQLLTLDAASGPPRPAPEQQVPEPAQPSADEPLTRPAIADAATRRGLQRAVVSPDGRWLCLFHLRQRVGVWDLARTRETLDLSTPAEPQAAAFSTSGDVMAVGDERGNVVVCRTSGGVIARFKHAEPISRLRFSPDAAFLAVASVDAALRLWPVSLDALKSQIRMPLSLDRDEWSAYMGDEPFEPSPV